MAFASYIRRERIIRMRKFLARQVGLQHSHENESRTEIRRKPFIRVVLVLDKTCSYKWYSSRLIFPHINGPIVTHSYDSQKSVQDGK